MSEQERRELLARIEESIEQAKRLSPEQALEKLSQEGFVDDQGHLAPAYGGQQVERR